MLEQIANQPEKKLFSSKKFLVTVTVSLGLILLISAMAVGASLYYRKNYDNLVYPGVYIAYQDVAGQKAEDIMVQLKNYEDQLAAGQLMIKADGKSFALSPIITSPTDFDFAKPIIDFDWEETITAAMVSGRNGNWLQNLLLPLWLRINPQNIEPKYSLNEKEIIDILKLNFQELEKPPQDASLEWQDNQPIITPENTGLVFDYQKAVSDIHQRIKTFSFNEISLILQPVAPQITSSKAEIVLAANKNRLESLPSVTLAFEDKTWELTAIEILDWIDFHQQVDTDEIVLIVSPSKAEEFFKKLTDKIDVPALDARFEINDQGRVTEFQSSQDGKKTDITATIELINQKLFQEQLDQPAIIIEPVVTVASAAIANKDLNNLGIKELLGRGVTNFAGSPANRRHNIAVGSSKVHGILIKPGETFSMLEAIGEVDGEAGYLKELVIKGNRTVPEYGGGLCQVSSTTFRAALRSGLPIVERRNHSFRVRYYEPAGLDATIYDPAPDLKFLNDTGYHILFITKIEGDNLIFEFYGTKDGRTAKIEPDPPRIYNVKNPGPPRYIETDELKPGEKKKVESAYAGADTYFKYTVTYSNGEIYEKDFYSRYVPWPEVWLVGKQLEPTPQTTESQNEENQSTPTNQTPADSFN